MSDMAHDQNAGAFGYHIPDEIKEKIPEHFYYALGGELVSVFGKDLLCEDEDGIVPLDYVGGTAGYVETLKTTCRKLGMEWLFVYWSGLEWYDSDLFDGEITDEVIRCFSKEGNSNPYYKYLLSAKEGGFGANGDLP